MHVETFLIAGPALLRPKKFEDARGFFSEVYSETQFNGLVGEFRFVQDNFSLSKDKGTVRGLHFQTTPYEQGKLVRATRGSISMSPSTSGAAPRLTANSFQLF